MYVILAYSVAIHSCYIGSKIVMSLYALQLGASQTTIGLLAALYALVPLVIGIFAGRLVDSSGTRWPLIGGAVVVGVAMLTGGLGNGIPALVATAMLTGAGFMFFNVSIQTLTGSFGEKDKRARNFAILSIGYSVSTFIGPVSVGLAIDHLGHASAFLMLAIFTLPPIIGLLFNKRFNFINGQKNSDEKRSTLDLLRLPPVRSIVVISGLIVAASDMFAFYLPVYAHSLNISATVIGVLLGVYAIAGVLTRFAMPALQRRWRAERVMVGCLLFAACAFVAFPMSTALYFMLGITFLLGLGLGCGQPLSMTIAYNRSPPGREGEVTGLRLTANNMSRVVIPIACGALGGALGAAPVFWVNALNLTAISFVMWRQ